MASTRTIELDPDYPETFNSKDYIGSTMQKYQARRAYKFEYFMNQGRILERNINLAGLQTHEFQNRIEELAIRSIYLR
jgi:hypothetical protein